MPSHSDSLQPSLPPRESSIPGEPERAWIKTLVDTAWPFEIVQCMGDLLDRAEFAEEMARRQILERLAASIRRTPFKDLTEETRAIMAELEELRRG